MISVFNTYSISCNQIKVIKLVGSGVIDATGYAYKACLKIKTSIITEHKEELLEFIIPCESNDEAIELNKMFRILKENGVVVSFDGGLPKFSDKSEYLSVTVQSTGTDLIKKYHDAMKPKPENKA